VSSCLARTAAALADASLSAGLSALLCIGLVASTAGCKSATPVTGDHAPEFVLPSTEGAIRKLSNFRGKVVLVNLWATWCPPCVAELPVLDQLAAKYGDKGLVVLAVAGDEDVQAVHDFLARSPVKFEVLLDPNGAIGTQYGITGYPETFFVDRQGRLQDKIIGPLPHEGGGASSGLLKRIEEMLGG